MVTGTLQTVNARVALVNFIEQRKDQSGEVMNIISLEVVDNYDLDNLNPSARLASKLDLISWAAVSNEVFEGLILTMDGLAVWIEDEYDPEKSRYQLI